MAPDGISNPGRIIPGNQLSESNKSGNFESRVEQSAASKMIKKGEDESDGNNTLEENWDGNFTGKYLNRDSEAQEDVLQPGEDEIIPVEYTMKFNQYTELVELIDTKTGNIIQTIAPNDLIQLISELKYRSGILIDNEV
jgi:uncharacterized FlaG/YvyC family protein